MRLKALAASTTAVAAIAMGGGVAPASAQTPCSAASQSFPDALADNQEFAPDIASMRVSVDAACQLTVGYDIADRPGALASDFYSWSIDADNNNATGSNTGFRGADYAIGLDDQGAALLSWDGTRFRSVKLIPSNGFSATVALADLGAAPPATIAIAGGTSWAGLYDDYNDWAPEISSPWFTFSIAAGGTAPPAAAPAPAASQTPNEAAAGCRVPNLKGLKLRAAKKRLRAARCKPGAIKRVRNKAYRNKVIRTKPGADADLANGATVTLVVGRR